MLEGQLAQASEEAAAAAARLDEDASGKFKALQEELAEVHAAATVAAAAAETARIELQTDLNNGRQRISAAEQARLELEVCAHLPRSRRARGC